MLPSPPLLIKPADMISPRALEEHKYWLTLLKQQPTDPSMNNNPDKSVAVQDTVGAVASWYNETISAGVSRCDLCITEEQT